MQQESQDGSLDPKGLDRVTGHSSRLRQCLLISCALVRAICSQQADSCKPLGLSPSLGGAALCSTEEQRLKCFHVQAAGRQAGKQAGSSQGRLVLGLSHCEQNHACGHGNNPSALAGLAYFCILCEQLYFTLAWLA